MTSIRRRNLMAAAAVAALTILGATSAATGIGPAGAAAASRISTHPAPPHVDWASIAPGEWKLVAVLPRGSSTWVRPGVGAGKAFSSPAPGIIRVSNSGDSSTTSPISATAEYGCIADLNAPVFVGSDLRGSVYWHNCVGVTEVQDTVGMQKSGASASFWNTTFHFGGTNFTAYSLRYTNCQFVNHQWRTLDQAEVYTVAGSGFFAGNSPYVSRYC